MQRMIHKLELHITDFQVVSLPSGAVIRSVGAQQRGRDVFGAPNEALCLWYEFPQWDDGAPIEYEKHTIMIVGTGNPFQRRAMDTYLGTVIMRDGSLVFHIYEAHNAPTPYGGANDGKD